ncbi:IS3 family transposase [Mycoplasmatota bacterium]|nr:IS3 family transposase [Mycoplasmatota bacterium]
MSRKPKVKIGTRISKKARRLSSRTGRAKTKEKVRIVFELRQKHGVLKPILEIANLAKSTYFDVLKNIDSDNDKEIKSKITNIYYKHKGRYGYRRITIVLRNEGLVINHKKVYRLMKSLGLVAKIRVKKYRSYKREVGKIANNELNRDFSTNTFKEKLVTDITEFKVDGRKIYLSPLIDIHNDEVISYTVGFSPNVRLVIEMLEKGITTKMKNTIVHSDQGFQYQNRRFQTYLEDKEITQSMSRRGNCLDNSKAENFFSHLKAEFYHVNKFKTVKQFIRELKKYINYYNNERIVTKLKMSPVQYREHCLI